MLGRNPFLRAASFRPQTLGQNILAMTGNACLIVFVSLVLFLTIIASRLQPEDLMLNPPKINDVGPITISLTDLDFGGSETNDSECEVDKPIDCTDQEVFHVMMEAAIEKFKDIHFNRFGKAVRGTNDTTCHMAWRFRPKVGKTSGFNKDYRTFVISRSKDCSLGVVSIGEYHSGENARKRKKKIPLEKVSEDGESSNSNDSLPMIDSEASFTKGRYLVYFGGGDRCKDMDHYLRGFTCALGEAQYLNRTLVVDLSICLSSVYSSSQLDEEGKDFRFYFDFQHLKDSASVLDQAQFWLNWNKWHQKDGLSLNLVEDFRVTPMKLKWVKDTLVMRKFGIVEPDNYWHRVCDGEAESVVQRPLHLVKKSKRLMDIASEIASRLNGDYDSVSFWRGGKINESKPYLESLLLTFQETVENGRNLYVAIDKPEKSLFESLKGKYSIHFLDEYEDLWDETSVWYTETTKLNNGIPVELDGYMRRSIDLEVFRRGKKQIES